MMPGDIPHPGRRVARYSARPFPAYRYVPGVHPHPTRDPRGHSYEPRPSLNRHAPWRPDGWRELDDWLYGVDLFNTFYFWEAHEAWEGLWAAVDRSSTPGMALQGLIQLAAALLKAHLQVPAGARSLAAEGLENLRHAAAESPRFMGLDLPAVVAGFESYFESTIARLQLPDLVEVPVLRLAVENAP